MSNVEFYKPHIKIKICPEVTSREEAEILKPIEINKYPDDLEVSCTVVRDCLQGNFALTLLLDVVNLSTYIKWQLLSERYRYIIVYAGYLGTNYYNQEDKDTYIASKMKIIFKGYILWMGTIVEARKKVVTRFLSVQNPAESLSAYTEAMSIRFDAGYNLYQLINDLARVTNNPDIKLNISEEDYNTLIQTPITYDDFNRNDINSILNLYGITISQGFDMTTDAISDKTYIQMNSVKAPPDEEGDDSNVTLVDENTGLMNIPTLQTTGKYPTVRFTMLFHPKIRTFDYVKLRNSDIQLPAVEEVTDTTNFNTGLYLDDTGFTTGTASGYGYYLVLKITYSLQSRGGNFTQEIEASPYNMYGKVTEGNQ